MTPASCHSGPSQIFLSPAARGFPGETGLFLLALDVLYSGVMKRSVAAVVGLGLALFQLASPAGGSAPKEAASRPTVRVSFRHDVAPLFVTSCGTASCHGGDRPPRLSSDIDPSALRAALVGVSSEEMPGHPYVKPGDTRNSYLVEKIEGRLVDAHCADGDCGARMPSRSPPLPEGAQAMIRVWIAQGAPDN
jgi:hypothetical protein